MHIHSWQDKYAETDWHREICFTKCSIFLPVSRSSDGAASVGVVLSSILRLRARCEGIFICERKPKNYLQNCGRGCVCVCACCGADTREHEAMRVISVCQLYSFASFRWLVCWFGSNSFGSRQSVYHLFSTQSRVSILVFVGKSRRHRIHIHTHTHTHRGTESQLYAASAFSLCAI